ncbi:MAG: transposase [Ignavibacteriales bacterium]|nr:transposase [Ignavibacteriales bacterium]
MNKYSIARQRRSIRLRKYDYSQEGGYYITICTFNKQCVFGEIVGGKMILSDVGNIVKDEWLKTPIIRPDIELGEFVIMPNHFHGVIILINNSRGTLQRAPTNEQFGKPTSNSIPTIVRLFKSAVTKRVNQLRNTPRIPVWQRNYWEHVIRNEDDLRRINEYIINNVVQWEYDEENPDK